MLTSRGENSLELKGNWTRGPSGGSYNVTKKERRADNRGSNYAEAQGPEGRQKRKSGGESGWGIWAWLKKRKELLGRPRMA